MLSEKIEITTHNIEIKNKENSLKGLVLAQISDLHINQWSLELIEHSIEVINGLSPDIVALTGDVICNGKKFIPNITAMLKNINANIGKYSCLGNHDYSDGYNGKRIIEAYKKADFQVLKNESRKVNIKGDLLYIAGADDLDHGIQDIENMVKNIPEKATSVFLTHNPFNFNQIAQYNPDLVLAGHTHGGQLYFSLLKFLYKIVLRSGYIAGFYNLNESLLYVNRGIGTALIAPVFFNKNFIINTPRINSKPEISLFKFI